MSIKPINSVITDSVLISNDGGKIEKNVFIGSLDIDHAYLLRDIYNCTGYNIRQIGKKQIIKIFFLPSLPRLEINK